MEQHLLLDDIENLKYIIVLELYTKNQRCAKLCLSALKPPKHMLSAEEKQPLLHVKKSQESGSTYNADHQCGAKNNRRFFPGHTERHRKDGGQQDVVDMAQHSPKGWTLHHALIICFQVPAVAIAPVAAGEAEEFEAVQGDCQRHISHAEEVATQPGLTAFFYK